MTDVGGFHLCWECHVILTDIRKNTHLYAFAFLKNSYASPKDNAPTTLTYTQQIIAI